MTQSFKACVEFSSVSRDRGTQANQIFDVHYNKLIQEGKEPTAAARQAAELTADEVQTKANATGKSLIHELRLIHKYKSHIDEGKLEDARDLLSGSDRSAFLDNIDNQETIEIGYLGSFLESAVQQKMGTELRNVAPGMRAARIRKIENFIEETYKPGSSKDTPASAAAEGVQEAFKYLANRLRTMGIIVPKPKTEIYLPQRHSRSKMLSGGADAYGTNRTNWVNDHMKTVDWEVMRHTVDHPKGKFKKGQVIAESEKEEALKSAFDNIVRNGVEDGSDSITARYSHQRFIYYKDAKSWTAMNNKYGDGDAWSQVTQSLQLMARDAAIVHVLGTKPDAMGKFIRNEMTEKLNTLRQNGIKPSKTLEYSVGELGKREFNRMLQYKMQGNAELNWQGSLMAGIRNVLTSSLLGGAYLPALFGDNFLAAHNNFFNGMKSTGHVRNYLKQMNPLDSGDRQLAIRAGLTTEASLRVAIGAHRFMGEITGPEMTRILTTSILRISLLSPHTKGNRAAHGLDMAGSFADAAKKYNSKKIKFEELPFINTLKKYGITEKDWKKFAQTKTYTQKKAEYLFPVDLARRTDLEGDDAFQTANKFMRLMEREMTFGTPESSARARFFLVSDAQPGTFVGEITRSAAMFKTFAATIMFEHMRRGIGMGITSPLGGSVAYMASFFVGMTIAGAFAQQARQIASGRDPLDMTTSKFWGGAALLGGGLGFLGDFMFSQINRYGSSMGEMAAGPVFSFFNDAVNLTIGNVIQAIEGEDTKIGRETVTALRRYLPGSSLWYAKTFLQRAIFDQMALMVDPEAANYARRYERKLKRERNQEMWWKFGDVTPSRTPQLGIGN